MEGRKKGGEAKKTTPIGSQLETPIKVRATTPAQSGSWRPVLHTWPTGLKVLIAWLWHFVALGSWESSFSAIIDPFVPE